MIRRFFFSCVFILSIVHVVNAESIRKGVWVSVFSNQKVLYGQEAVLKLIEFCKKENIQDIYLQVFRSGIAYYDSKIADRAGYEKILQNAGIDTIDLLLKEAKKADIKVFAWINTLSLGKNRQADIIKEYGDSIFTRDQYLRPSLRTEFINESDRYYLRDNQIFLEPGDPRVSDYIIAIVSEIIRRYPLLNGLHLDYIRYPYPIPYIPRSNFNKYGLTYGYGEKNIEFFKNTTGLDPLTMPDAKDNFQLWDNWKRENITRLVKKIYEVAKGISQDLLVSCAVIPSPETAYSVGFQDWPLWLENGFVDYVVLMNYTRNNELAKTITISALGHRGKGRIFAGIGCFLMEDEPGLFSEQTRLIENLKPDGIVFFSYDALLKLKSLKEK